MVGCTGAPGGAVPVCLSPELQRVCVGLGTCREGHAEILFFYLSEVPPSFCGTLFFLYFPRNKKRFLCTNVSRLQKHVHPFVRTIARTDLIVVRALLRENVGFACPSPRDPAAAFSIFLPHFFCFSSGHIYILLYCYLLYIFSPAIWATTRPRG